ncbi:hypothetical protein [Dryocola clanedunensis]
MSYSKNLLTLAIIAAGYILPMQAHALPQVKKVSYNTTHSHKRAKKPVRDSDKATSFAARQR